MGKYFIIGAIVGAIISGVISEWFAPAMGGGLLGGGILFSIIGTIIFGRTSGISSSSASIIAHAENRKNYPNKCISCTDYSTPRGECRRDSTSKDKMDSCSNWR